MNTTAQLARAFRSALEHHTTDVVGLVDNLLKVCQENELQLDWQAGRCRVRSFESDWEDLVDLPLRKSVFRAILARVAVLCNERRPNSMSLYGGQGEITVGGDPATVFRVAFVNSPSEQRLELTQIRSEGVGKSDGEPRE